MNKDVCYDVEEDDMFLSSVQSFLFLSVVNNTFQLGSNKRLLLWDYGAS